MASGNKHLSALLAADLNRYFEHLVLTYQDQLYAFVLLIILSRQAAQEIVQAALERAYYALKNYSTHQIRLLKPEPWLSEITRNVLYNYVPANPTRAYRPPLVPLHPSPLRV